MIDQGMLLAANCKYLKIEVSDVFPGTTNDSFDQLLKYIGKYYCSPLSLFFFETDYAYIHCAYTKIKEKIRPRLYPYGFLKHKLKVSNREIYAIRTYYQGDAEKHSVSIARIPYKVAYIFNAIIEILDEMWHDPNVPSIPSELTNCIKQTYAIAFYQKQIDAYDHLYNKGSFSINEVIAKELYNDFHADKSPFLKTFKR